MSRVPSCNLVSIPHKTCNVGIFKSFNSPDLSFPIHKWGEGISSSEGCCKDQGSSENVGRC